MFHLVDFCRLCLCFKGEFTSMCNDNIMEKVVACITDLEFDESLPALICTKCMEHLDMFFDFRNRCLKSEFLLNCYIDKFLSQTQTYNKFCNTRLKVSVLKNYATSSKLMGNVKISKQRSTVSCLGETVELLINDSHVSDFTNNKIDSGFKPALECNLDKETQDNHNSNNNNNEQTDPRRRGSIVSEDEDDIFFEEEDDEEIVQLEDLTDSVYAKSVTSYDADINVEGANSKRKITDGTENCPRKICRLANETSSGNYEEKQIKQIELNSSRSSGNVEVVMCDGVTENLRAPVAVGSQTCENPFTNNKAKQIKDANSENFKSSDTVIHNFVTDNLKVSTTDIHVTHGTTEPAKITDPEFPNLKTNWKSNPITYSAKTGKQNFKNNPRVCDFEKGQTENVRLKLPSLNGTSSTFTKTSPSKGNIYNKPEIHYITTIKLKNRKLSNAVAQNSRISSNSVDCNIQADELQKIRNSGSTNKTSKNESVITEKVITNNTDFEKSITPHFIPSTNLHRLLLNNIDNLSENNSINKQVSSKSQQDPFRVAPPRGIKIMIPNNILKKSSSSASVTNNLLFKKQTTVTQNNAAIILNKQMHKYLENPQKFKLIKLNTRAVKKIKLTPSFANPGKSQNVSVKPKEAVAAHNKNPIFEDTKMKPPNVTTDLTIPLYSTNIFGDQICAPLQHFNTQMPTVKITNVFSLAENAPPPLISLNEFGPSKTPLPHPLINISESINKQTKKSEPAQLIEPNHTPLLCPSPVGNESEKIEENASVLTQELLNIKTENGNNLIVGTQQIERESNKLQDTNNEYSNIAVETIFPSVSNIPFSNGNSFSCCDNPKEISSSFLKPTSNSKEESPVHRRGQSKDTKIRMCKKVEQKKIFEVHDPLHILQVQKKKRTTSKSEPKKPSNVKSDNDKNIYYKNLNELSNSDSDLEIDVVNGGPASPAQQGWNEYQSDNSDDKAKKERQLRGEIRKNVNLLSSIIPEFQDTTREIPTQRTIDAARNYIKHLQRESVTLNVELNASLKKQMELTEELDFLKKRRIE